MMREKSKYSFSDIMFSSAFIHNPVLIQTAGLCAVVAVATTLQTALLLALTFFPVMIVTQMVACLLLKRVPRWIRVMLYLLIGSAMVAPLIYFIDLINPEIRLGAGVYLGLTAANSITALHCEKFAVKTTAKQAFFDAVAAGIGYAAVLVSVGFFRELLGASSVWGRHVSLPFTVPSLLMPFGGFIVLAFCAAALKAFINRRFPEYSGETELTIKKTAVIVSKKNLPENAAAHQEPQDAERQEQQPADAPEEEPESQEEPEQQAVVREYDSDIVPLDHLDFDDPHSPPDALKNAVEPNGRDEQARRDDEELEKTMSRLFETVSFDDSPDREENNDEQEGEK